MDSGKLLRALGCQPFRAWPVGDELFPTDRRWHFDRASGEGSRALLESRLYRYPGSNGVI
jgi:hypothetical protein